eukprot:TRINITY_DN14742_c0_g1_i1.p1 TRINITY_DN14742_c0_g1~~TRINITY_DN14742_c0_g1_i1.p1  ORF type:complete len:279 (-),score=41.42 TRINITY_DN14742_c0_g1_i1:109-945(-)
MFGAWTSQLSSLAKQYDEASPYPHVIIPNFFSDEWAAKIVETFPEPIDSDGYLKSGWVCYNNPIERKLASPDSSVWPPHIQEAFQALRGEPFRDLVSAITRIPNLEDDPHLHGGGLHYHPRNSKLDMHLDYSVHPLIPKQRRLNLIVYMTPNWQPSWGGALELWEAGMSKLGKKCDVAFNQAVLFRTSDESWHGLPDPIQCPDNVARKSLAVYYLTDPAEGVTLRYKAQFVGRPDHPEECSEGLNELRKIRVNRHLTPADVAEYLPDWNDALAVKRRE